MLSPIGPDPLAVLFFIISCLKFGGNVKAAPGEVNAYMNTVAIAVDRLKKVEAVRDTTWCPQAVRARIDHQLQKIRRALHDAQRNVSGVYVTNDARPGPQLGAMERLAWILKYRNIAKANQNTLDICLGELHQIQDELDQARASPPKSIAFFKKSQAESRNVLSKMVARQTTMYQGKGELLALSGDRVVGGERWAVSGGRMLGHLRHGNERWSRRFEDCF